MTWKQISNLKPDEGSREDWMQRCFNIEENLLKEIEFLKKKNE